MGKFLHLFLKFRHYGLQNLSLLNLIGLARADDRRISPEASVVN